jgi:hypothetical protein
MNHNETQLDDLHDYSYTFEDTLDIQDKTKWTILKNWFERKLYFSAGIDLQLMQRCPHSERVKAQCIGGTVIATALLAFISSSYAFYTVFSEKPPFLAAESADVSIDIFGLIISIVFGLIWGLMIYNLDRFIVSSTGHGDGTNKISFGEFCSALPRILMAVAIGFVLSKPIEITIMKSEIQHHLKNEQTKALDDFMKKEELKIVEEKEKNGNDIIVKRKEENRLQKEIDDAKNKRDRLEEELRREMDGKGGSGVREPSTIPGRITGPIARKIESQLVQAENEYKEIKNINESQKLIIKKEIDEINQKSNRLTEELKSKRNEEIDRLKNLNGLIKQIEVAHQINPQAVWFLMILLAFIEIAPILFKMMTTIGPYDYLVEDEKLKTLVSRGIFINKELNPKKELNFLEQIMIRFSGSQNSSDIDKTAQILGDAKMPGNYVEGANYRQVEVLKESYLSKLNIIRDTTKFLHELFYKKTINDIELNPDKYINNDSVSETKNTDKS